MNKLIVFFKNNKEIIVLIPTLLGGLYQILNIIIFVGMPYIRYFSVSQVIPDGLLISLSLFWFYIVYKVVKIFYEDLNPRNEENINQPLISDIISLSILFPVGFSLLYYVVKYNDLSSFSSIIVRYGIYAFSLSIILTGLSILIKRILRIKIISIKIKSINAEIKRILIRIIILIFGFFILKVTISEISNINSIFIKVSNFENYIYFSKEVKKTYNLKSNPELLYINKDYAFFNIKKNDNTILIVDAKILTENRKNPPQ